MSGDFEYDGDPIARLIRISKEPAPPHLMALGRDHVAAAKPRFRNFRVDLEAVQSAAVKVGKAASKNGSAGDRLDAAIRAGKKSADDVVRAGEMTAEEAKEAAAKVAKAADS